MDLLRFEDKDVGPVYLDGRFHFVLAADKESPSTKIIARDAAGVAAAIDVLGDADEVAQAIERAVPGARIHRIV
jgi:hypothetical protein